MLDTTKPDPPAPLLSTWQVRAAAGEPVAIVRVHNLSGTMPAGRDAWGRPNRPQPALLSAEVSFARPFATASQYDAVNAETAHYGTLSKSLLGGLDMWTSSSASAGVEGPSSADVFEMLWVGMTGRTVDGSRRALPLDQVPFLDAGRLRSLRLSVDLPKASLLGAGVGLTVTACFKYREEGAAAVGSEAAGSNPLRSYARSLRIHGLHVPTLIGVNANERTAKQMVVADVEIDRLDVTRDIHPEVERVVVDAMEASSFETLEALGTHVAEKLLSEFKIGDDPKSGRKRGWQVKINLAKPIAVPLAECPSVEVIMGPN